jgi:hypothetical protein
MDAIIRQKGVQVATGEPIIGGGLGLLAVNTIDSNKVMLQVPNYLTFTVSTSKLDANPRVESLFQNPKAYIDAPWWAKLSVDLNVCDQIDSRKSKSVSGSKNEIQDSETVDMRPWLDSLPRSFDTPIRWTKEQREALQYPPILSMIAAQEKKTRDTFQRLKDSIDPSSPLTNLSFEDFLWGCDCARSRAFSGAYGGTAFDPKPYALTLLLVAVYLGLGMGTVEQASNGAALVFCGTILKDFVLPKLFKSKKYVICPLIDMANHRGTKEDANVAFEYFANSYSLSTKADVTMNKNSEIFISYGPRSNDALLQQYGFVECDNTHDVYIMPPLREWDIGALEESCGRTFQPGRLEKLERAGLLGGEPLGKEGDEDSLEEGIANRGRGVVITRAAGIDPAILTALRVLVSTNEEWDAVGQAVGNMVTEYSGGKENERIARNVAKKALELELMSKATTLEQDEQTWKIRDSLGLSAQETLALQFRMEKKKLLKEAMFALSLV